MLISLQNPLIFLNSSRLDLVVKYMYAKSYLENNLTDEIRNLYAKHIEKRTGGIEPIDIFGTPTYKYSIKDYEDSFISLIESLKRNGFDSAHPIPLHSNGIIGNGAHRISASIALGLDVYIYEVEGFGCSWDFLWFQEHDFTQDELTNILYHWCLLKTSQKSLNYIILWAPTQDFFADSLEIIKKESTLVGYFDYFFQDINHLEKFLLNLYAFSSKDTFLEAIHKKILLLKQYELVCKIVIINDVNPFEKAKIIKENLRNHLSKYIKKELFITTHCLDSEDEVEFFNRVFFNKVILENTNNVQMIEWFLELNEVLEKNNIRKNDICIVGSSVMDIFNIRSSTDIDFTVTSELRNKYGEGITKLSSNVDIVTMGYHRTDLRKMISDDELIQNPENHFVCRGYKFANLNIVKERKEYSRREKDLKDIELIDNYYLKRRLGTLYKLEILKRNISLLVSKTNIYSKSKQYIKTRISNFVNRIAIEVAQITAREVSENIAREIGTQVAQITAREVSENIAREIGTQVAQTLIEQNNLTNSHKFNKLMGISFELSKRLNFVFSEHNINPWEYYKNKQFGFWFGDFSETLEAKEPIPNIFCAGLNCVLGDKPLGFSPNGSILDDIDILLLWGQSSQEGHIDMIYNAFLKQKKIVFVEDGFFYNVISHVKSLQQEYPSHLSQGMSFTIDDITAHFDGSLPSRLEQMINSDIVLEDDKVVRSNKLIQTIVENKITKYNYQSIESKVYGNRDSKVLIVDQAYGDYSVYKSGASEEVFHQMINDAIVENPESDILVKIHPDMIVNSNRAGAKNGGYFGNMQINHPNVIIIKDEINPYVIIEQVQSIYVCTSQLGFEGLMSGKKVYCYGVPFYAGWGLTIDRGNMEYLKRRVQKRSVEEVFWFAYIWYSRYYSPVKQSMCEIEEVIENIKKFKEYYQNLKKEGVLNER